MTITQDARRCPATRGNGAPLAGGSQALTSDQLTQAGAFAAMARGGMPLLPTFGAELVPVATGPGRLERAALWCARKIRALWRALPGPWWVKGPIMVACLLVPGPLDELAVIALAGFLAVRKARAAR